MKKTLGTVAGAIGLLLVLTSLVTLFVTIGSLTLFVTKLSLGVALLIFWGFTARGSNSTVVRSAFFFSSSIGLLLAFIAVLAAANYIVAKKSPTWDLTAKKVYSLAPQTQKTVENLRAPVKVIAFVEGPIPEGVEALFQRYARLSEKFTYEFKDPRRAPDLTARFQIRQGQPAAALIEGEQYTMLNLERLQLPQIAEQELTNGLLKLEAVGSQKLYLVEGHGEIPLEPQGDSEEAVAASLATLKRLLGDEGYSPSPLNLIKTGEIPRDASAIIIAGARTKFSEGEKKLISTYLEEGGRLIYFAEAQAESGLEPLLAQYGVQVEPGIVADAKVNPKQPYLVYTPFFSDHEIARALKAQQMNAMFATTRALTLLREDTLPDLKVEPLVLTTPYAWADLNPGENPEPEEGERNGQLTLAAVVSRPAVAQTHRAEETRLVVFGDSDLLAGTLGHPPNLNLVFNSIAWATQQIQKITIRPPDRDISTMDLTNAQLDTIRLLSMDVLPTALLAIGLSIWLTRRSR